MEIMPNRKVSCGDLRTIISYKHVDNEHDPDEGYYVVQIQIFNRSRIIRQEEIVTDNLNIFDYGEEEE